MWPSCSTAGCCREIVLSWLLRFPLRVVIPIALVLFAVLISAFLAFYNFSQVGQEVEQEIRQRVVQHMTRTQGTLRNLSRKHDAGGLQLEVSQLGSDPLVVAAALIDGDNKALYATQYALVGKDLLGQIPGLQAQRLAEARRRQVGEVILDAPGTSYLAYYPVDLWGAEGELGSARPGLFFLQYDLHTPLQQARGLLVQQLIQFSLVIAAFSGLLWLMFHFSLTRRVDCLVNSVNRFGEGDMAARAELAGQDEIAKIGHAFDDMVSLIVKDRQHLADSEGRMRAILDNVGDCILTTDEIGMIQTASPALEAIFGYRAPDMVGRHLQVLLTEPCQQLQESYRAAKDVGDAANHPFIKEVCGRRRDGDEVALEVTASDFERHGERLFVWILRDITERKKVDRLKNEFVSVVSHELRTPLTSILGSLGLLNAGVTGQLPEQAQQMLTIAQNNSERLVRLINDILDIEKMESGELTFAEQTLDLAEIIRRAVEANQGFAERYSVCFQIVQPLPAAMVSGDADRLTQVLFNLLSNAAKYSPQNGVVKIALERRASVLRVTVRDLGPGIDPAFRERIFAKFVQADSSDTRKIDGTGLGLSIAKSIVELHGGHIGFTSPSDGGTEFYFDLPEYQQPKAQAL